MSSESTTLGVATTGGATTLAVADTNNPWPAVIAAAITLVALGIIAYFVRKKVKRQ